MLLQEGSAREKILDNVWLIKDVLLRSINDILASIIERLPYIVAGLFVLVMFWLLSKIAKHFFLSISSRTKLDHRLQILFSRLIVVILYIFGLLAAFTVVIPTFHFGDLIAGLGFTSFVIGFATKDILNNLLSGILILWQQPFRIGDYIFVGNNQGKVENIGIRATQLRKDDGELVLIPNGDMYSSSITIRGAGSERRMSLQISVSYNADIVEAKEIIRNVLKTEGGVVDEPKTNVVVTDLSPEGVDLAIYFWVNTDKFRPMQVFDSVATEIKKELSEAGIEMYPPNSLIVQTHEKEPLAA
ncbi:MAG TPA: mechanosensitive ion channel family protein [Pyrinomonadaceae bacterium]|nr:mechanosensitive ion channel family protein [Pyrinomonadaceae bacterium]